MLTSRGHLSSACIFSSVIFPCKQGRESGKQRSEQYRHAKQELSRSSHTRQTHTHLSRIKNERTYLKMPKKEQKAANKLQRGTSGNPWEKPSKNKNMVKKDSQKTSCVSATEHQSYRMFKKIMRNQIR